MLAVGGDWCLCENHLQSSESLNSEDDFHTASWNVSPKQYLTYSDDQLS